MEYVELEAQRKAKAMLEKNGMKVPKFELKSGAPGFEPRISGFVSNIFGFNMFMAAHSD